MYKAQWPLEEKVKPIVKAQITQWLENGVIERAPPGNPYNSPLFPVRKKNAQGEYSGDCRVVMDCRLVNAALDPAKSDRFPLPLISELHPPMGLTPLSSFVQRQLTNLFADLNDVTTNFIDDITVHTEADMETHINQNSPGTEKH
ncbi:hypothetical protein [Parasitella parasitica]|uniref:Reverse transcriptase domain-containing protein n=1 Tax=Parasitella parasitica TaxID=35722 RepID=A0A0B7NG80_9FUNG|nr:hypothetical protein [Parasitella parasitica]